MVTASHLLSGCCRRRSFSAPTPPLALSVYFVLSLSLPLSLTMGLTFAFLNPSCDPLPLYLNCSSFLLNFVFCLSEYAFNSSLSRRLLSYRRLSSPVCVSPASRPVCPQQRSYMYVCARDAERRSRRRGVKKKKKRKKREAKNNVCSIITQRARTTSDGDEDEVSKEGESEE